MPPCPRQSVTVPNDPLSGIKGREIIIETNYLKLNLDKFFDKQIFQYEVAIEPFTRKELFPEVMEEFRQQHFPAIHTAFDGSKFLLSPQKFDPEYCGEVIHSGNNFKVTMKYSKLIDLSAFTNCKDNANLKRYKEICQVLSIILRAYPMMNHLSFGRHFYKRPEKIIDLTCGMQLLYGLFQAPVFTQRGLMLNVDVLYKAHPINNFSNEIEVLALICEVCHIKNLQRDIELTETQIESVLRVIKNKTVIFTVKGKSIKFTVKGFKGSPTKEVLSDNKTTIEEYFVKENHHEIKYRNLQLLWDGKSEDMLIPVELCVFEGGQRKIDFENHPDVLRNIICNTTVSTGKKKQQILELVEAIGNYKESPFLREFGIEVGTDFEAVRCRILEPPVINYTKTEETGRVKIDSWTIINLDQLFSRAKINRFVEQVNYFYYFICCFNKFYYA